jgi:hypothetical protein
MNKSFPLQIYPSQLQVLTEKINELAEAIADALSQKKLSSFKRNDYVSIGMGYKSHTDLIDRANSRKQADKGAPLLLFVEPQICDSINKVLCHKIEALNTETCSLILSSLGQKELGRKIISDIKGSVSPLFSDRLLHKGSPKALSTVNSNEASLNTLRADVESPMNQVPELLTTRREFKRVLREALNKNDIIFLTGKIGSGKSLALSEIVPKELIIDTTNSKREGFNITLEQFEFDMAKSASGSIFAIDEAHSVSSKDVLKLVSLAYENKSKLIIATQIIMRTLPIKEIQSVVLENKSQAAIVDIYKLGCISPAVKLTPDYFDSITMKNQ